MKRLQLLLLFSLSLLITTCSHSNSNNFKNTSDIDSTEINSPISKVENRTELKENKIISSQDGGLEEVNTDYFKAILAKETKTLSAKDVIKLYYPAKIQQVENSYEKINIKTKKEGNNTIVTLVHDNQPHITIQGHRIILVLTSNNNNNKEWEVISIVQQFKCWARENGSIWGTNRCS